MPNSYVLDAHALIWQVEGNPKLGAAAAQAFADLAARFWLPATALAEACYVVERGRVNITSANDLLAAIDADPRIQVIPLDRQVIEQTLTLSAIAEMHDRQIVATALLLIARGDAVALLTKDANITASGLVPVVW